MTDQEYDNRITLLKKYGTNSFSAMLLYDELELVPLKSVDGGVPVRKRGGMQLVFGEPLCAPENYRAAAEELFAESDKRSPILFLGVSDTFVQAVQGLNISSLPIGDDFVFNPQTYKPQGNKTKVIRVLRNQANRAGVTVHEYFHETIDESIEKEISSVANRWLKSLGKFKAHIQELDLFSARHEKRFFYARCEGKMVGVISTLPIYGRNGLLFEDVIRDPEAPHGVMELLVLEILDKMKSDGYEAATFGISPRIDTSSLSGASRIIVSGAAAFADKFFGLKTLHHFRKKFHTPQEDRVHLLKYPGGFGVRDMIRMIKSVTS